MTSLPGTPLKSSEQSGPQPSAVGSPIHPVAAVILDRSGFTLDDTGYGGVRMDGDHPALLPGGFHSDIPHPEVRQEGCHAGKATGGRRRTRRSSRPSPHRSRAQAVGGIALALAGIRSRGQQAMTTESGKNRERGIARHEPILGIVAAPAHRRSDHHLPSHHRQHRPNSHAPPPTASSRSSISHRA